MIFSSIAAVRLAASGFRTNQGVETSHANPNRLNQRYIRPRQLGCRSKLLRQRSVLANRVDKIRKSRLSFSHSFANAVFYDPAFDHSSSFRHVMLSFVNPSIDKFAVSTLWCYFERGIHLAPVDLSSVKIHLSMIPGWCWL